MTPPSRSAFDGFADILAASIAGEADRDGDFHVGREAVDRLRTNRCSYTLHRDRRTLHRCFREDVVIAASEARIDPSPAIAVVLLNKGLVDVKPLISATLPYRDAARAFALAAARTSAAPGGLAQVDA